jgi:DNA-binding NarL/FixJ family response regulator
LVTEKKPLKICHVLICHPVPLVREGLKKVLSDLSSLKKTRFIPEGELDPNEEALCKALYKKGDMVILGYESIVESTIENIRKLRQDFPELMILILTMNMEIRFLLRIFKAGVNGLLSNRAKAAEIAQAIETVCLGKNYVPPAVIDSLLVDSQGLDDSQTKGISSLTDREKEVFQLIADGLSQKEIAKRLFISWKTVMTHRYRIMKKLKLKNCVELTKLAIRTGMINL